MNAFISYSIDSSEQYILSLLAQKLAEAGLTLVTSYDQSDSSSQQTANDIKNAAVFIGLITRLGTATKASRVYSEFRYASLLKRPAILLVEDNAPATIAETYGNAIRFNRYNINQSIDYVKEQIKASQVTPPPAPNTAAWVLGGLAVIALLSLLSDDK